MTARPTAPLNFARSAGSCCTRRRCRAVGWRRGLRVRRLARRRRPVLVAGAAARAARRSRLAVPRPVGLRRLAGAARRARRARLERRGRALRRAPPVLERRLGGASPAATRSPTRCASSASGRRCARTRASAACACSATCRSTSRRDGADHVAHPELFQDGVVAGVPPDVFSANGQLWGNPLYDWPAMRAHRLPLVDRALPPHVRARRPRPHRPLPRLRRRTGRSPADHDDRARGRWRRAPGRELLRDRPRASSAGCR